MTRGTTTLEPPLSRSAPVGRQSGAGMLTIAAVGAAVLIAAAGFAAARSLGSAPTPPAAVCSETCAPTRTVNPPKARHSRVALPTSLNHERSHR